MCEKRSKSGRCYVCEYAKRKQDIYKWSYSVHKNNAKKRGIPWKLTFEQFKRFAKKTKLLTGAGRTKDSLSIDRKNQKKGYTVRNIQVLTVSENSKKYIHWDRHQGLKFRRIEEEKYPDAPF